jgi:hypothetical protein
MHEEQIPLRQRYERFTERLSNAADNAGRRPQDIITVAVTKYADIEDVRRLVALGHADLGENQVQQLTQRAELLTEASNRAERHGAFADAGGPTLFAGERQSQSVRWHMIGSLQRNKVKKCLPIARLIQSVDSLRLVDEINNVAIRKDLDSEVLIQVNVTDEPQKSGCPVGALEHLCEQIDSLVHVHVRGIMVIGPTSQDETETRRAFERARELFEDLRDAGVGEGRFNILSMGMSGDFELAIRHGSNMIRVGSAIFGPRPKDAKAETDRDDDE